MKKQFNKKADATFEQPEPNPSIASYRINAPEMRSSKYSSKYSRSLKLKDKPFVSVVEQPYQRLTHSKNEICF